MKGISSMSRHGVDEGGIGHLITACMMPRAWVVVEVAVIAFMTVYDLMSVFRLVTVSVLTRPAAVPVLIAAESDSCSGKSREGRNHQGCYATHVGLLFLCVDSRRMAEIQRVEVVVFVEGTDYDYDTRFEYRKEQKMASTIQKQTGTH